jgi:hypothetical protein
MTEHPCDNKGMGYPVFHCKEPAGTQKEYGHNCPDCPYKPDKAEEK